MSSRLEKILTDLGLRGMLPAFRNEKIDDSLLTGLSDADLREIGITKLGDRKRLLAAFSNAKVAPVAGSPRPTVFPSAPHHPPPPPEVELPKEDGLYTDDPGKASHVRPFLNSLGMPFVPITRTRTLFCIWPVRILDYAQFCVETGAEMPTVDFPQAPDHPVVNVAWNDAHIFCEWLTKRDIWLGLLDSKHIYRLPKDEEWSAAVGLPYEHALTPRGRSGIIEGFPWGADFPPPYGAGNYHHRLGADDFPETSPVGSFAANNFGIHDLGGNVWEWCMDEYDKGAPFRVLRGGSCFNDDPEFLHSSYRDKLAPEKGRNNVGMRIVLSGFMQADRDPWIKV